MRRWARRLGLAFAAMAIALVGSASVLDRPGDRALHPPAAGAHLEIVAVVSHGYHAGLVVRRDQLAAAAAKSGLTALEAVTRRFAAYDLLEIGFGDESFYRRAPTLASVEVLDALRALFGPNNPTVVHVVGLAVPTRQAFPQSAIVELHLSGAGFARLAASVEASFDTDASGGAEDLGPGLYGPSLFYRGVGRFHLFNVCNHWLARQLSAAGVATNPVLATWPAGLIADLRWRSGASLVPVGER